MGIPQDPRRAGRLGDQGRSINRLEILKANGIGPAMRRTRPTWLQFMRSEGDVILASDFFTAGLPGGTKACVLAVIEHATRRIRFLASRCTHPGRWTTQQACNLLMDPGGQRHRARTRTFCGRILPDYETCRNQHRPHRSLHPASH
jgi:hypothetical protein